jgi:BRCT domain type II-containing protein
MLQFDRKVFVFTGKLSAMQRRQAEEAVKARGGMVANGQIAPSLEKALLRRPDAWKEIERGLA